MTEVLIAQLGTPSRWSQFSPHFETVRDYFGAQPEQKLEIRMREVTSLGALRDEEFRTSIPKDSRNWSFEIGGAATLEYPNTGQRPTVVFIRQADGSYLYQLLMPRDTHYDAITEALVERYDGSANQIPQAIFSAEELKIVWPAASLWNHWH